MMNPMALVEPESNPPPGRRSRNILLQLPASLRKATKANPHFPPQGIRSAGGSTRPKGGHPPAGNQIRRRHLVRPTGRRERAISLPLQGRWSLPPSRASRPTKH